MHAADSLEVTLEAPREVPSPSAQRVEQYSSSAALLQAEAGAQASGAGHPACNAGCDQDKQLTVDPERPCRSGEWRSSRRMAPRLRLDHLRMPKVRMCTFITPRLTFKVLAARCMCMGTGQLMQQHERPCATRCSGGISDEWDHSTSGIAIATRLDRRGSATTSTVCNAPLR